MVVRNKPEIIRVGLKGEDFELAQRLMEEARQFGGDVSNLELVKSPALEEYCCSVFSSYPLPGITIVRDICRIAVLKAHGADRKEYDFTQSFYEAKKKYFGLSAGEIGFLCLWRDWNNNVIAKGELWCFKDTPLLKQLIALRPTNRSWSMIFCWDLGDPKRFFEENRIIPESAVFLFSDELGQLKRDGKVLTRDYHDIMEEEFEGFLIAKRPDYGWETVYRIRARLLD